MNKNIILKALQSQLETVKAAAISHEENVYEPAVAKLTAKVKAWFEANVIAAIHDIRINSDSLVIVPNDSTAYGNDITITHRSGWRRENAYFESSSYRPELSSNSDNTHSIFYHTVMAAVATNFMQICEQYKDKWMPVLIKLEQEKNNMYEEKYKVEREIRNCESEIAEMEKQVYNQAGFECTLKPHATYESNCVDGEYVYTMNMEDYAIKAQYGRGRWDYYKIHSFKVISFPNAKHAKVVLEYKQSNDDKPRTAELNKQRYADFINEVYKWQTRGADERAEAIKDRVERYNERATA